MNTKNNKLSPIIISLAMLVCSIPALSKQLPFVKSSLKTIEKQYTGKPFLLVLWSMDCPPCRDELQLLGQLKNQQQDMNLVLISTDDINQQQELDRILAEYQLTQIESWTFATKNISQLRYVIDPQWFGEMPRSYFYNTDHKRVGVSGKLKQKTIMNWIRKY